MKHKVREGPTRWIECVGARTTNYRRSFDTSGRETHKRRAVRVRRFRRAWPALRINTRLSHIPSSKELVRQHKGEEVVKKKRLVRQ
jgi:hypothetical protein